MLRQAEIEEGHPPTPLEQVVAWMRITVESMQPVQAAEDEPVDRLRGQVALVLVPALKLVESLAYDQLAGQHPCCAQLPHDLWDVEKGMSLVVLGEELLAVSLELVVELLPEPFAELFDE